MVVRRSVALSAKITLSLEQQREQQPELDLREVTWDPKDQAASCLEDRVPRAMAQTNYPLQVGSINPTMEIHYFSAPAPVDNRQDNRRSTIIILAPA